MIDVLVIEDDLRVREFIRRALGQAGIDCRLALSGQQALRLASEAWPDLVVLDLTLAGHLDGWQVWDRLLNVADDRPLSVVVLTGDHDPAIQAAAQVRQALGILYKPIHPAELTATVGRALAENH